MIRHRILGFIVKSFSYLVLLLGLGVYGHMQHYSPRKPDPSSGHVLPAKVPHGRSTAGGTIYLTSSELFLYHASFIVIAASTLGILGHAFMIRKRATSLG